MSTEAESEIRRRAKKLMQGLLTTQKIADGRDREEAWLRCRRAAAVSIQEERDAAAVVVGGKPQEPGEDA